MIVVPSRTSNRQSSQCPAATQLPCEGWARWGHLSSTGPRMPLLAASFPAYPKLPYTVCGSTSRGAASSRVGAILGLGPVWPWDCLTTVRESCSDRPEYAVCCRRRQRQAGQGSCHPQAACDGGNWCALYPRELQFITRVINTMVMHISHQRARRRCRYPAGNVTGQQLRSGGGGGRPGHSLSGSGKFPVLVESHKVRLLRSSRQSPCLSLQPVDLGVRAMELSC